MDAMSAITQEANKLQATRKRTSYKGTQQKQLAATPTVWREMAAPSQGWLRYRAKERSLMTDVYDLPLLVRA